MARTGSDGRRERGFEPAFGLMRAQIRAGGESRGFALTRMLTHWAEVAGPDMAAISRPVKMSYGREGMGATLVLLVQAAHAPMIQMALPGLKERVNATYGYNAVSRISLTQTAATGFAEGQAAFSPKAPLPPPTPDPALAALAARQAEPIHDASLRAALEKLALNVLSRQKPAKG